MILGGRQNSSDEAPSGENAWQDQIWLESKGFRYDQHTEFSW